MSEYHENLFNHYSESDSTAILENNLTRALAISLADDALFRDHFLRRIITKYDELTVMEGAACSIALQLDASKIDALPNIYAVSLTTREFDNKEFELANPNQIDTQITDLTISYADCTLVIEVKRSDENCLSQLRTQITKIPNSDLCQLAYKSMTWAKVIRTLEDCFAKRKAGGNPHPRISMDFLEFLKSRFPQWVEAKALSRIPSLTESNIHQVQKRIDKIKYILGAELGFELNSIGGRLSIPVNWKLASEVNIRLDVESNSLKMGIWPGDTKLQGWNLWCNEKWKQWINDDIIGIKDKVFQVKVHPYVKFSHFTQGIDWVTIPKDKYHLLGQDLFRRVSGRKKRVDWASLEKDLDDFLPKWKTLCGWESLFQGSNRNYVDISIGVEYDIYMPFNVISKLDTEENGGKDLVELLKDVLSYLESRLINSGAA